MTKKMQLTLQNTPFRGAPVVAVAARPDGPDDTPSEAIGVEELIGVLKKHTFLPNRQDQGPFVFAVDHCFSIRGQGTVMTGTVLQGAVAVNDNVEIPSMAITRKVKSIQMFRKPVERAVQGDRVGICVTQFDPKQLERGIACTPGFVPTIYAAVIPIKKIPYFKGDVRTKAKFHISLGHETVMAKVSLFGLEKCSEAGNSIGGDADVFDFEQEYRYQDELLATDNAKKNIKNDGGGDEQSRYRPQKQFALLDFEHPVSIIPKCLVIGSKLDTDIHANTCRLAFMGRLLVTSEDKNYASSLLPRLRVFKDKQKEGLVERLVNEYEVIGKNIFKKETNIQPFVGLQVRLSTGEMGSIDGSFGQSGKVKIRIPGGLQSKTVQQLGGLSKKKGKPTADQHQGDGNQESVKIYLEFKRYIYDPQKKMVQTRTVK